MILLGWNINIIEKINIGGCVNDKVNTFIFHVGLPVIQIRWYPLYELLNIFNSARENVVFDHFEG